MDGWIRDVGGGFQGKRGDIGEETDESGRRASKDDKEKYIEAERERNSSRSDWRILVQQHLEVCERDVARKRIVAVSHHSASLVNATANEGRDVGIE